MLIHSFPPFVNSGLGLYADQHAIMVLRYVNLGSGSHSCGEHEAAANPSQIDDVLPRRKEKRKRMVCCKEERLDSEAIFTQYIIQLPLLRIK